MARKKVREDVQLLFFVAKLYILVVGAFVFAVGRDISAAISSLGKIYGG